MRKRQAEERMREQEMERKWRSLRAPAWLQALDSKWKELEMEKLVC